MNASYVRCEEKKERIIRGVHAPRQETVAAIWKNSASAEDPILYPNEEQERPAQARHQACQDDVQDELSAQDWPFARRGRTRSCSASLLNTMPLRDDIQRAQATALKERQADRLSTLRMLWSAIRNEEINQRVELDDTGVQGIVARQVKQLADALKDFEAGHRDDLADKARAEIALLQTYLPTQLSDQELQTIVEQVVKDSGGVQADQVGKVMGMIMKEVKGRADGNRVRAMVTALVR